MSLTAILNAISADGASQVCEIEAAAQRQVEEILSQAEQEAQRIRIQTRNAYQMPASRERARLIHQKRLEALRLTGNVREDLIETALGGVRNRLANIRLDPRYPEILIRLTREALGQLGEPVEAGEIRLIEADPRDREYLEAGYTGGEIQITYSLTCWGGVIAQSEDGKVVVINTLEERLARAMPQLRRHLGAIFEQSFDDTPEPALITKLPV